MTDQNERWFLAGLAVSSLIGSNVLTGLASKKAAELGKKFKESWKYYIPTAIVVALGAAGIIGGNVIADGVEASLMLAAGAYAQNRSRLNQVFRNEKPEYVEPEIGELLFFDATRGDDGAYFSATIEDFVLAMYELNRLMQVDQTVSYGEFYRLLRLRPPRTTDDKGWSIGAGVVYGYQWIDVTRDLVTLDDGLEVNVIRFVHQPTYDYLDYHPDEPLLAL